LHWEIYIDIYDELKLCYRNLEILTLSGQQQYTNLLDIKHCSLSCSLFLFSSTEGRFSQQPKKFCRPVPLPAEKACGHVVGGHIHAIFKPKKNILMDLEMASKGASIRLQIVYGW
jgi:hypothetical protein